MKNVNIKSPGIPIWKKKIPAYWLGVIFSVTALVTYLALQGHTTLPGADSKTEQVSSEIRLTGVKYVRMSGYSFARPFLFADVEVEDQSLTGLKSAVSNYIDSAKKSARIQSASVYFKKLDSPSCFEVNNSEEYVCASLFKVPVMIAMLMQADKQPGYLDRKVIYDAPQGFSENVTPLTKGKFYTLREMIQSMVSRSDNVAYNICWNNMDTANFMKLLKDIQVKPFNRHDTHEYTLKVMDYSKFFRILYNASYLSKSMSDFALKTLSESDFNNGLVKNIKDSVLVARKFGLRVSGNDAQLSEFGIFYNNSEPYLLGVMTRGNVEANLYPVLSDISSMIYEKIKSEK